MMIRRNTLFALPVAILAVSSFGLLMAAPNSLKVNVQYTAGDVSAEHPIWIFVWSSADFQNTIPIAAKTLTEKGQAAEFESLSASTVFVTVAYDEQGGYNPMLVGAPPSGTPVAAYVTAGATAPTPIQLSESEAAAIELSFDGTFRMP